MVFWIAAFVEMTQVGGIVTDYGRRERLVRLCVVVPVYNEQSNLPELHARLTAVLLDLNCDYDVIVVDDASTDESASIVEALARQDSRWHGVRLARNFGHQAAITAGLAYATGDAVVVMDGDLQDEPEAIPRFVELWRAGYDTVYAVRVRRKEGRIRRLCYWLFYRVLRLLSSDGIPGDAGDFCLMSRRVVDALNGLPERSRFIRGLRAWVGFRQIGLTVERQARAHGDPKYTPRKLVRLAMDGLLDFSWVPLRASAVAGVLAMLGSFVYLAVVVVMRLTGRIEVEGWTTVIFWVIFWGGMQMLALGIIGEYLGRAYVELKRRPTYVVSGTTDERLLRGAMGRRWEVPSVLDMLDSAGPGPSEPAWQDQGVHAEETGVWPVALG